MLPRSKLGVSLQTIRGVLDVDDLLIKPFEPFMVERYYNDSRLGYTIMHCWGGAMHLALNFNGRFDVRGYYTQAEVIHRHIEQIRASDVLELGSGNGFNILHLAKKNRQVQFTGVDSNKMLINASIKKSENFGNVRYLVTDFEETCIDSDSFDLIFAVESACYASSLNKLFREVNRLLRPGGRFVVFDGFRKQAVSKFEPDIQLAMRLVEAAVVISRPPILTKWLEYASKYGFIIASMDDLTSAVLPNLERIQFLARAYYRIHGLARILHRRLPYYLAVNAVAGLLMPFTVLEGAHGYYCLVMESADSSRKIGGSYSL